ncbi:DUF202 domain-containing protein [Streptacidiphilus fuscans]|uniref:DUF202 domain-containing protein n=1 Tax=Streptacidiphilus fuscans TaxID=2789292 RepID=A0A931BCR0_9ACTN|nr:DUF202 domain-containing protein [Streptacidiphilus fuscans]MBF9071040.1 DUF202 domain-containing protein [Streptacidiphilus fuscans]
MAEERDASGTDGSEAGRSDDELFAELVAGFDEPVAEEERSWPESEDLSESDLNDLSGFTPQSRPRPVNPPVNRPAIRPLPMVPAVPPVDPRSWTPAEDPDEDHYVPPDPRDLPKAETPTRMALLSLIGGIVLALLGGFGQLPGMATFLGVAFAAGGVVTLVARMKDTDDDDHDRDDPNHGAVV